MPSRDAAGRDALVEDELARALGQIVDVSARDEPERRMHPDGHAVRLLGGGKEPRGGGMSNRKLNLESMTLEDLWSLHETISGMLSARIKVEKRELEKRLAILNRGMDMTSPAGNSGTLAERPRRSYPAVLPKYRNPQTSETWSGRGKRPRWVGAQLRSGMKVDDLLIARTH